MTRRNEIIINGVRHILKDGGFYPCRACSLRRLCGSDPICQKVFGRAGYFEIYKRKEQ